MPELALDSLRLDLFLKQSRLIKRRSVAKALCDAGRVQINGREAKAGALVRVGDGLRLDLREQVLQVRVERLPRRVEGPEGIVQVLGAAE